MSSFADHFRRFHQTLINNQFPGYRPVASPDREVLSPPPKPDFEIEGCNIRSVDRDSNQDND